MTTYKVKDHEFVRPFQAENDEQASRKALKILGFNYIEADKMIKEHGAVKTLQLLDYVLEVVK